MAADLAHTPSSGLRVQACGDAHLSNFGAFATPERSVIFDINDLDETLPAPWEWDVKRLTASVVLAGRHIQLKQSETARAARAAVRSYREHMTEYSFMKALDIWYDRIDLERLIDAVPDEEERARIEKKIEKARGRTVAEHDFPKLAEHVGSTPRIKDNPPLIFHSEEIIRKPRAGGAQGSMGALPRLSARAHPRALQPLSSVRHGGEGRRRRQRRYGVLDRPVHGRGR